MIISSLKEQSKAKTRISLTLKIAQKLITKGHTVLLDKDHEKSLGYTDTAYLNTSAKLLNNKVTKQIVTVLEKG